MKSISYHNIIRPHRDIQVQLYLSIFVHRTYLPLFTLFINNLANLLSYLDRIRILSEYMAKMTSPFAQSHPSFQGLTKDSRTSQIFTL